MTLRAIFRTLKLCPKDQIQMQSSSSLHLEVVFKTVT